MSCQPNDLNPTIHSNNMIVAINWKSQAHANWIAWLIDWFVSALYPMKIYCITIHLSPIHNTFFESHMTSWIGHTSNVNAFLLSWIRAECTHNQMAYLISNPRNTANITKNIGKTGIKISFKRCTWPWPFQTKIGKYNIYRRLISCHTRCPNKF